MGEVVTIPVQVTKIETKVDRSIKITAVSSLEVDPIEAVVLFSLANKVGYMAFSEAPVAKEVFEGLPEIEPEMGEKTPAQRMRGVLYAWWEQQGKKGDFELFYRRHYERMINQVKEKLT